MNAVIAAVVAGLCGSGVTGLIQFLISRHDTRHDDLREIRDGFRKIEKDSVRTQMLVLMSDYPEEEAELMKIAQHYFEDLKGDWYMTSLFNKHLIINRIAKPVWFSDIE